MGQDAGGEQPEQGGGQLGSALALRIPDIGKDWEGCRRGWAWGVRATSILPAACVIKSSEFPDGLGHPCALCIASLAGTVKSRGSASMSFDGEWEQAKARAVRDGSPRTRLNQMPASGGGGGGGGEGTLVAVRDDLGRVGHAGYKLHGGLSAAGGHAKANSKAAGAELTGDHFATGAALTKVVDTWQTQVDTLLEACAHISNHLDYSSKRYGEDDAKIETGMHDIRKRLMTPSRIADYYR